MNKKIGLIIVILVLCIFRVSAQDTSPFPDVSPSSEWFDAITYVKSKNIVRGYNDGTFRPQQTITRGEFTKIIINSLFKIEDITKCRYENRYYSNSNNAIFTDIKIYENYLDENVFTDYICLAKHQNILGGYSDGKFYPDRVITVGEASKIISNSYKLTSGTSTSVEKFKMYVDALYAKKAIPGSVLYINDGILRGEVAEVIYRLDNNIQTKTSKIYEQINLEKFGYTLNNFLKVDGKYYAVGKNLVKCPTDNYVCQLGYYAPNIDITDNIQVNSTAIIEVKHQDTSCDRYNTLNPEAMVNLDLSRLCEGGLASRLFSIEKGTDGIITKMRQEFI